MTTTAVMDYIKKHGSFDSFGYELGDPYLESICKKALENDTKVNFTDLYAEPDAIV